MKQTSLLTALICAMAGLAFPPVVVAQAPAKLEPHLFIAYALDDLLHTDLPDPKEYIENFSGYARFHARQVVKADKMVFYLSREKNREAKLIEPLEAYRAWLGDVKKLVQAIEDSKRKRFEPFFTAKLQIKYEQIAAASAAQASALTYGLSALGQGQSFMDAFFVAQGAATVRAIQGQIRIEAARAEALLLHKRAVAEFIRDLQALVPARQTKLREQLAKLSIPDEAALGSLADKYRWNTRIENKRTDWTNETARPHNPFVIESVVRSRKIPEGLAGSDQHLDNAKDLLFASKLVPASQEFLFFKTHLLGCAGSEANNACAAQIGKAGFSSINRKKARMAAALLAQTIWKSYVDLAPAQPWNDRELSHQIFLAYAYGTTSDAQHALVRLAAIQKSMAPIPQQGFFFSLRWVQNPNQPSNPDFWYDAACLCGAQGFTPQALTYLETAVRLGFDKVDEASVNADLEPVRAANENRFRMLLKPKESL